MIRLRGHHLICLHFFTGAGYSRVFVDNLRAVLQRAGQDEEIVVTEGADEVCEACPYLAGNCCAHKPDSEQEIRRLDELALNLLAAKTGQKVKWEEIRLQVLKAPAEWFCAFCHGCDWETLCQGVQKRKNLAARQEPAEKSKNK